MLSPQDVFAFYGIPFSTLSGPCRHPEPYDLSHKSRNSSGDRNKFPKTELMYGGRPKTSGQVLQQLLRKAGTRLPEID